MSLAVTELLTSMRQVFLAEKSRSKFSNFSTTFLRSAQTALAKLLGPAYIELRTPVGIHSFKRRVFIQGSIIGNSVVEIATDKPAPPPSSDPTATA
ncbi:hypothetical protein Hte_006435 [Hypoxylon texense]